MGVIEFVSVLVPSAAIGVIYFILFSILRKKQTHIYRPKIDVYEHKPGWKEENPYEPKSGEPLKPLSNSFFGWISELYHIKEETILEHAGIDAIVFLRTLKLGMQILVLSMVYTFVILIPVYATGFVKGVEDSLNKMSMANITPASDRLWAATIGTYVVTFIASWLIFKHYKEIHPLVKDFKFSKRVENYSVIVTQISKELRNEKSLMDFFQTYPGNVESVVFGENVKELISKINQHTKISKKLEKVQKKIADGKKTPHHRVRCCGAKVESETTYKLLLDGLQEEIINIQKEEEILEDSVDVEHDNEENPKNEMAFVTFSTLQATADCLNDEPQYNSKFKQAVHANKIRAAYEPHDVRWQAIHETYEKQQTGTLFVNIFFVLLIAFWTIPIAFLSGIMNLENLKETFGEGLEKILDASPIVTGVIQGILPTLALVLFMSFLPKILLFAHTFYFPKSTSHLELICFRRYYICLVVMIFFVNTIAGSFFEKVEDIMNEPNSAITLLGESLPKQALFFMGYVALKALGGLPGELAQIVPLILSKILGTYWDKDVLPEMNYFSVLAEHLLIFTISVAYTILNPFMLIWGVLYFGIGLFVWKHQFLFVYFRRYETGGRYWPDIVNRFVAGIIIFQLTTIGSIGLREGAAQSSLLFPSVLVILYVQYRCHQRFRWAFVAPSARFAQTIDEQQGPAHFESNSYVAPMLKENYENLYEKQHAGGEHCEIVEMKQDADVEEKQDDQVEEV